MCIFFLLNGTLNIDNLNGTNWRRKFTCMPCNDSDLPSTVSAKLPSKTQVDSSRGQRLAGLKDCSDDWAIQSHMAVKILVGTDELPPDSAGVQPSFISVEFDFPLLFSSHPSPLESKPIFLLGVS